MYYPLFVNLKNKKILIIGGGKVGSRRALYLLKAGATIIVISMDFDKKLGPIKNKNLKLIKKDINKLKINFKDYFLVIIATNDKKTNERLTKSIKNNSLVCRADKHSKGNVIFPAYVKKKGIGITSFGKKTSVVKKLKSMIK